MRGNPIIGRRIPNPILNHSTKQTPFLSSSHFSTSSSGGGGGGGGGRGRGGSGASNYFDFTGRAPGKPDSDAPGPSPPPPLPPQRQPPQSGIGHGRGGGNPILPAFSSFISSLNPSQSQFQSQSPIGRGRGRGPVEPGPSRKPAADSQSKSVPPEIQFTQSDDPPISGLGRGIPHEPVGPTPKPVEENRHIKARPKPKSSTEVKGEGRPKLSREDAVKRTVSILSQQRGKLGGMERGGGSGRGRGIGRGRGGRMEDSDDEFEEALFADDDAFGEQLAEMIGAENMNKLTDAFEEMSEKVLPSPLEDAIVDAMDTNYMIEFEPEYLMGEFDQNPDIDEKPPMPLRDVLEKVKPFIMAYEGIQSHEQWEEVVEETMKRVPLLKEIVDHYSGPDRVTAKKQQEELERVAKTIPASAPASVKRFTDRAVLSLQSNPGWGFDKKCQFMDKLVREINQCYN